MTEVLNLLKKDHQKVKALLEELEATTTRATVKRKELLQTLKQELELHEEVEEKLFYPELKKEKDAKSLILEAYEEHHVVDVILAELESTEVDEESWIAKLTVLKENLLHHIKEEETEIFPKARKDLGATKLEEIGVEAEKMKEEHQ